MTASTNNTYSQGVLSILPMFYVAWSDSVLSPSEMKVIHKKIEKLDFLDKEDKLYLISNADPLNPPSPETFKSWLEAMRNVAKTMPLNAKASLAQLGAEMAQTAQVYKSNEVWDNPETLKALVEIEKELGVANEEDLQAMLLQFDQPIHTAPRDSSFDEKKMEEILDGKYGDTKRKVYQLLRDPVFNYAYLPNKEDHRAKILELLGHISAQGLGNLSYDTKYGGQGKIGDYMSVFETLAHHDLSLTVKYGVQFGLFGGALSLLGTDKHHRKYVEPTGKGQLLGCFAMTETGHGSNVKQLETTLTYHHNTKSIVVNSPSFQSGKEYIGNAFHCTMAAVFGQLIIDGVNHGIHAALVPMRDSNHQLLKGVDVKDCGYKIGLNGVDNGRIWFDNVSIPVENLLDKYGGIDDNGQYQSKITNENKRFFTMLGALVAGRVCVGHAGISAARVALTVAVRFALKRRQFGPENQQEQLIMDYPSHQVRLIPRVVKAYMYHFALENLREYYIESLNEDDKRKIETKAAGLKAKATWFATETIQTCRETCGGKGYLWENRFGELKGDSDIFTTFEGDNTVLMQLVAKGLLTEFKQSFHDDGFRAVMRYALGKVSNTIAENNPYARRKTDIEHLMSDEFHSETLRYREKKVLMSLSSRMQDFASKRANPYDGFLKVQNHMIYLAHSYVDRLVYREMDKKLVTMQPSDEKEMLIKIKKYYALNTIYENRDWYLENDYFEGTKTKAIRRILNKMNQDFRPEMESMVNAFGIPQESLRAEVLM